MHIQSCWAICLGNDEERTKSVRNLILQNENGMSDECYLEAWFSPRRFKRSRKRRWSGVGVLGLKATKYQSGWLRSLLSQVSVLASALGCRPTFSRMAPYGCFASLFSVFALARGCSLIRRSR